MLCNKHSINAIHKLYFIFFKYFYYFLKSFYPESQPDSDATLVSFTEEVLGGKRCGASKRGFLLPLLFMPLFIPFVLLIMYLETPEHNPVGTFSERVARKARTARADPKASRQGFYSIFLYLFY